MTVTRTLDTSKPFKFTEEQLAELAAKKYLVNQMRIVQNLLMNN